MSLTVLSFLFWQSTTVHSLPVFFGMHSIGAACGTLFISHHPVSVYIHIFSDNCCFSVSGHLGRWYEYCLPSSKSGILWFISRKGGNFGIIPLNMSLYSWNHWFHNRGISPSVMGLTALIPASLLAVTIGSASFTGSILPMLPPPPLRMHDQAPARSACVGSQSHRGGFPNTRMQDGLADGASGSCNMGISPRPMCSFC